MIPRCTKEEWLLAKSLTDSLAVSVVPAGWQEVPFPFDSPFSGCRRYVRKGDKLKVLFSADRHEDERVWIHVSMSFKNRVPSYQDMCDVKRLFIGPGRKAIQVFAAESDHVNIHPNCLHIWACDGSDGLPDFGKHGSI